MQNTFSAAAAQVVVLAEQQARRFNHSHVGTEHLLLGVVDQGANPAARVLATREITLPVLHDRLHFILGEGAPRRLDTIPLSRTARSVLAAAEVQARDRGQAATEPADIVLALLAEKETNLGTDMILSLGVEIPDLVRDLTDAMTSDAVEAARSSLQEEPATPLFQPAGSQLLDQYGRNLTREAAKGAIDPVIGRDREIGQLTRTLSRRIKNNPVLIGDAGVGKTAVVEGLARNIAFQAVPKAIQNKQIYAIELVSMVAGSRYRGDFEDRFKKVIAEVVERGDIILFVDEIHMLVGAGSAEGSIDAANILKPILSRGEIKLIGTTTPAEFRKSIERDSALNRRLQRIEISEPTLDHTREILLGLRPAFESHHEVTITLEAIDAAIALSERYLPERFLPDKAIDLIDEASSAAALRLNVDRPSIGADDIAAMVAEQTSIPVAAIGASESERLAQMPHHLHQRIVGMDQAIDAVSKAIKRSRAGIRDPHRPIGSFIFAGPPGVGKTELAKALAEFLFGKEDDVVRFDMSEFSESHSSARLIGSAPGYVGYDEGGQLTEQVRRKPFSVVLFDEAEKAHLDVYNVLLQVIEDGSLTDSSGRHVDFTNTVIILTTNLGSRKAIGEPIGFFDIQTSRRDAAEAAVKSEIADHFAPEFVNRIDDIIVFPRLLPEDLQAIVDLQLGRLAARLAKTNITLRVADDAREKLARVGADQGQGARPLRRAVRDYIEDPLSDRVFTEQVRPGHTVHVRAGADDHQFALVIDG